MTRRTAAPKDRSYLESLNLKQLQKDRKPAEDQDKREFYQELQQQAKEGPLFQEDTLGLVEGLPELPKHVTKWLANLSAKGSQDIDPRGLNLIVDWANGDPESSKIQNMTWDQAMEAQKAWHESTFEVQDTGTYNTKDVVQDLGGGWTMVQIDNEHDLDVEGDLMGHCVGGEDYWDAVQSGESTIYSLRDPQNKPHVTIEVSGGRVQQCFGKQNVAPVKKYNSYLVKFFEKHNLLDGILHLEDTSGVTTSTWMKLAKHPNANIRIMVATQRTLPTSVLEVLAKDPNADVRRAVVENPTTSGDVLKVLVDDSGSDIRYLVAKNPATPVDLIKTLAEDADDDIRRGIASNTATPAKTLEVLAKDPNRDVRQTVARNPNTPESTLSVMSKDPNSDIRYFVTKNTSTPVDVLELLTQDYADDVRFSAKISLKSRGITTAALKDRQYLESLNLKQLQKDRKPAEDQDKREFYQELQTEAKSGPLFQEDVLTTVERLPDLPKPVAKWLANLAKTSLDAIDPRGLNLILDWVKGDNTANIQSMTWDQAMEAQKAWHESNFQLQDTGTYNTKDVVQDLGGGWTMVEIKDRDDLTTEGDLMGHCVGGDNYWKNVQSGKSTIYSLRDPQNRPHVTIEVMDNHVAQCYGKQNVVPVKKYNPYLIKFFEKHNLLDGILQLQYIEAPDSVWRKIVDQAEFVADVIEHPDFPTSLLREVAKNPRSFYALSGHPETPTDVLDYIYQNLSDSSIKRSITARLVSNKNLSKETATAIATDKATPVHVLAHLAWVSKDPDILDKLATHSEHRVRHNVAENQHTDPKTLAALANDPTPNVAGAVALNPNTPEDTLLDLATNGDTLVRADLSQRDSLPDQVFRILAKDPDLHIRRNIALRLDTPVDLLRTLAQDKATVEQVVRNPNIPVDLILDILKGPYATNIEYMAYNTNTKPEILDALANNPDMPLHRLEQVIKNPSTSKHTLETLAKHENPDIQEMAKERLHTHTASTPVQQASQYGEYLYRNPTPVKQGGDVRRAIQTALHPTVTEDDRTQARTFLQDHNIDLEEEGYLVGDVAHILAQARTRLRLPNTLPFYVLLKSDDDVVLNTTNLNHYVNSTLGKSLKMRVENGILTSPYFNTPNPRMLHDFILGLANSKSILRWGVRTQHITQDGHVRSRIGGLPVLLARVGNKSVSLFGQHPVAWNGPHTLEGLEQALDVGPRSHGWLGKVRPDKHWNYQWTTFVR